MCCSSSSCRFPCAHFLTCVRVVLSPVVTYSFECFLSHDRPSFYFILVPTNITPLICLRVASMLGFSCSNEKVAAKLCCNTIHCVNILCECWTFVLVVPFHPACSTPKEFLFVLTFIMI
jgi:hypothetical protein